MAQARNHWRKNLTGKHMLVVEDHPGIGRMLMKLLAQYDHASYAASGKQALEEIDQCPPDLILVDLKLPDIDGLELARLIRRKKGAKSVPILAMSGTPIDKLKYLEAGCDDFILKPFQEGELLDRLSKLLRPRK
jgi:DNA-binding response OmpR family regulator